MHIDFAIKLKMVIISIYNVILQIRNTRSNQQKNDLADIIKQKQWH